MTVQIGFLRAVNVGNRRVAMARLKQACEDLGHAEVWTHVNSGNVVFEASGSRAAVEKSLGAALESEFGFECTTFVRTAAELRKALAITPFRLDEGDTYFITFLATAPSATQRTALEALSNEFDTLEVHGADVHWRMRGKSTDSRLGRRDWDRILGPLSSTSRNVRMLTALSEKIDARG